MADGIGLSVGATALRAVVIGRSAVTRSPVLTLYPNRPAEVGVPSENPNLAERGLIITDFVDRVGDPVAILAPDGSSHRAEVLLADALRALLSTVTGGRPPAGPVGVTHPAHWSPAAVDALRRALAVLPEFRDAPLISDAVTSLTALQDDPGLPTRGVVALCDVGGSGASITLGDAANGFAAIGPTIRYPDLSGDLIDQALLTRVVGDLGATGVLDLSSTSAIGSLGRLRGQCRAAKERLSTSAVTSMPVDLPGRRTDVRVTRIELDDAIRGPLTGFVELLQDSLQRSGIRPGDLVAVASVGGGARLPILTTTLSEHLRVPVVTSSQPELAAAIGSGLKAVRGLVPDGVTSMAPAAAVPAAVAAAHAPGSSTFRALAWSDADELPEPLPGDPAPAVHEPTYETFDPRPQMAFTDHDEDDAVAAALPWYRRPVAMVAIALIAAAAVIATAAWYVLRNDESPATTPSSGVTTTAPSTSEPSTSGPPASETPPLETQAPEQQAPQRQTVTQQAPAPVVTVTEPPPPVTETPPPPPTTTEAPPPPTTEAPTTQTTQTTQPPASTQAPIIPTLPYQTIPGLPFVPAPIQPAQP